MKKEIRAIPATELRVIGDGADRKIVGYAAVYNSLSHDLGGFRERILPGAFDKVVGGNVMARYNHDLILGRTKAGTLKLSTDERGLRYEITPTDSAAVDHVVKSIRRNDVEGSSFAFSVEPAGENWMKEGDTIVRELRDMAGLFDVGPVDQPAYPGTEGTVSMRALDKARELRGLPKRTEHRAEGDAAEEAAEIGNGGPELDAAVTAFQSCITASRALVDALTARSNQATDDEIEDFKEAARYAFLCQDEVGDALCAVWQFIDPYGMDYYRTLDAKARETRAAIRSALEKRGITPPATVTDDAEVRRRRLMLAEAE